MDGCPVRIHLRVFRSAGLTQIAHTIRMGGGLPLMQKITVQALVRLVLVLLGREYL